MPLVEAALIGAASGGAAWVALSNRARRAFVAKRMKEDGDGLNFPYAMKPTRASRAADTLTLEDAERDKISKQLFLAGVRTRKPIRFYRTLVKVALIVPLAVLGVAALAGGLNPAIVGIAAGSAIVFWLYARLFMSLRRKRFERSILRSLPQFLDLLVVCMEAGFAFPAALDRMLSEVDPKDPLTKEFRRMYQEFLAGFSMPQACERLARRLEISDVTLLLSSVVQAERMGSSLGSTLRVQARELRDKARQRARGRALQIPVKMLFPMMLIFVSLFGLTLGPAFFQLNKVMARTSPEAMRGDSRG